MMTGVFLKSWKNVKQHIPLIKFRKGGHFTENTPHAGSVAPASREQSAQSSRVNITHQLPVVEDWQLPPQYRRALLDEKEIDAINSGGAY